MVMDDAVATTAPGSERMIVTGRRSHDRIHCRPDTRLSDGCALRRSSSAPLRNSHDRDEACAVTSRPA
ncbi:Uncharacterised protein [Mycobacteroides abscessus subsp. abscessus]|nr:Uncharacterised protein [Mycobacteroides abscessus subsp. abscessus]